MMRLLEVGGEGGGARDRFEVHVVGALGGAGGRHTRSGDGIKVVEIL